MQPLHVTVVNVGHAGFGDRQPLTADTLRTVAPEPITGFHNRRRASWTPLLAIAALAGPDIDSKIREAAKLIENVKTDTTSHGTLLLADIRDIFRDRGTVRLKSTDIVAALVKIEGRPWAEWKQGKPITTNALATVLADFGIRPKPIRFRDKPDRGYELAAFEEAFERYVRQESQ